MTTIERVAAHVAPAGTRLVEVDADGGGERHGSNFPLWTRPDAGGALEMDPARARSAGRPLRPIEESVDDVRAWFGDRAWPERWLSPEDEKQLLDESTRPSP